MQEHSPFERGYVGNHDAGAPVAVLDKTFPRERLLAAGADEVLVDRLAADLDDLDHDTRLRAIDAFEGCSDEELIEALSLAQEQYDRQDAFDALPEPERTALEALSEEERASLAAFHLEVPAGNAEAPEALTGVVGPDVHSLDQEQVLALVDGDAERAAAALAAEQASDSPRADLVEQLTEVATRPPADTGQ